MKYLYVFLIFFTMSIMTFSGEKIPIIAVDGKAIVEFGTYPAKERKEAFYKIVNKGDAVLQIGRIRKTCGCAEAKIDKKEIMPGEFGILKAVVLADSIYGGYRKNIYVSSNDPKQRFLTLTIAGNAVPILKIKPKAMIYAGSLPAGKEWKQNFLLEAAEPGVELKAPIVQSNTLIKAVLTKKSDKLFQLIVTITPEKDKTVFKCKIKIPLSKPKGWKAPEILITGTVK